MTESNITREHEGKHGVLTLGSDPGRQPRGGPAVNGDTEREALARNYDPEAFEDHPIERRSPLAAIQWGARRKLAQDAADRVLGSGWLAARDKRMKAEQAETDAGIVEALSAGEHTVIAAIRRASDD